MTLTLGDIAQIIGMVGTAGALYFAARAAFHTKILQVSINGRMERLLEATAEAAAARAREEVIQHLILDSVQEASETASLSSQQLENAFSAGRLHEVKRLRFRRYIRK